MRISGADEARQGGGKSLASTIGLIDDAVIARYVLHGFPRWRAVAEGLYISI